MSLFEVEQTAVAMILDRPDLVAEACALGLAADRHFPTPELAAVFRAAVGLWEAGTEPTVLAVAGVVGRERMGELCRLVDRAPPTQNFAHFAQALIDGARAIEVQARIADISRRLTHRHVFDPLAPILDDLAMAAAVAGEQTPVRAVPMAKAVDESIAAVERTITGHRGISTGIPRLDDEIYGWRAPFVYVLGARTGVGKTTLALNFAVAAADAGYRTAYFTVEMHAADLADKVIAERGRVNLTRLLNGNLSATEMDSVSFAAPKAAELPIEFVEMREQGMARLEAEASRQVRARGAKLLIVDYLQIFELDDGTRRPRYEEFNQISKRLKRLATRLDVPIIALSQLNRQAPEFEQPNETHLAGSDQIGRDADVILLLWRDDEQRYELTINKHRRGRRGAVALDARLEHSYFGSRA